MEIRYPCHRAKLGNWTYYVAQLSMKSVSTLVELHEDIFEKSTKQLSNWLQRPHEKRKGLIKYLATRPDRFFSAIVVGFKEGKPDFHPLNAEDMRGHPNLKYFVNAYKGVDVGVLEFPPDDNRQMYALDGQHRLYAIRDLLKNKDSEHDKPAGFESEMVTVIFVPLDEEDSKKDQKYRRLFTSLNRYAKKTDAYIDIILDDDDIFAILTRRLIEEHPFFDVGDDQDSSSFVSIIKGKNMTKTDPGVTNLRAFYDLVTNIFWPFIKNELDPNRNEKQAVEEYKQFRPDEDKIDFFYDEISKLWNAIVLTFPILSEESPIDSRDPNKADTANLLFTPMGQNILGAVIKHLIAKLVKDKPSSSFEEDDYYEKIKILGKIPWKMREVPWEGLVCIEEEDKKGKMRWVMNDKRSDVQDIGFETILWLIKKLKLNEQEIKELKTKWKSISENLNEKKIDEIFEKLIDIRTSIN